MNSIKKYSFRGFAFKIWVLGILLAGCEDNLEVDVPISEISRETVFDSDDTAIAALRGVYSDFMASSDFISGGRGSITEVTGLSSDELTNFSEDLVSLEFNLNNIVPNNRTVKSSLWDRPYNTIYNLNAILEGLENEDSSISAELRNQILGEAKFLRAFVYFHLINLYGDVPLIFSTNFEENNIKSRTVLNEVYDFILEDLMSAKDLIADDYSFADGERIIPNSFAVDALLARVFLFLENWEKAEFHATLVISNSATYSLLNDLNSFAEPNGPESIWQLKPVNPSLNTWEGLNFLILPDRLPSRHILSLSLLDDFEDGDLRREAWIDSVFVNGETYYFPNKYKIRRGEEKLEYSVVLRLAEQYLIRAEARINQGNIQGGLEDVNRIRSRAGLPNLISNDTQTLLNAIDQERRIELFVERGHRWFDLKRRNLADDILGALKEDWQSFDKLYPIPQEDIEINQNLVQNEGY